MTDPLRDLENVWEAHARHDPLWAILSDPTKKNRGWEVDRFFESGEREVRFLLRDLEGIDFARTRALDFGCGVGRLTHALASYFDHVTGLDISPTMIDLANALNHDPKRVDFVRNLRDDLSPIASDSCDFAYTNIVLQHMPPELAKGYLVELIRTLRPGGVLVFQLPSHPRPDEELTVRAMPEEAYRAAISVHEWPKVVAPATRIGIAAYVMNASRHAWHPTALGQVNLGNHWIANDGTMERQDDARAGLPKIVRPGEEVEVRIGVTTPAADGSYRLELDLVHETITWFKDRGSPSCELSIEVRRDAATPSDPILTPNPPAAPSTKTEAWIRASALLPESTTEPEPFSMFCIERAEVTDFLKREGVELLRIDEDGHAGWEWVGYRYTVRKTR